jgi:hypothetical protein
MKLARRGRESAPGGFSSTAFTELGIRRELFKAQRLGQT